MVKLDEHYINPRLVTLYDFENTRGRDTDFYVALANALPAQRIIDLGCGTGLLTRELAVLGRQVIGVDPSPTMLAFARQQPGAENIQWIEGDASALGTPAANLVVMTGNVAQVFLEDSDWQATLEAIHDALRPGGYLAFESRNPLDRAWERWNREATYQEFDSPVGRMQTWLELLSVGEKRVRFEGHNIFTDTGEVIVADSELRFRTCEEITTSLQNADFVIERVYGDWDHKPFTPSSRTMIFVARRTIKGN